MHHKILEIEMHSIEFVNALLNSSMMPCVQMYVFYLNHFSHFGPSVFRTALSSWIIQYLNACGITDPVLLKQYAGSFYTA
jgi:hypothetical protein